MTYASSAKQANIASAWVHPKKSANANTVSYMDKAEFLTTCKTYQIMAKMQFNCPHCGRFFDRDVVALAKHIGEEHDVDRRSLQ